MPERRLANRRQFTSITVAALMLGLAASWFWAGRVAIDQKEDRDDLELFLEASSAGWAQVTDQFFAIPESAASTIGALSAQMTSNDDLVALLVESIRDESALDAAFLGFPDGSFAFVARDDEDIAGGFRTRKISFPNGARTVDAAWLNADLTSRRAEVDADDTYDPRDRPWYQPIAEGAERSWSDPYVFASSQQPGITYSSAVRDDQGDLQAVVGIDIRLTQLSEFLDRLRPGSNGEALVVDRSGTVIAAAPMNSFTGEPGQALEASDLPGLIESLNTDQDVSPARSADRRRTTIAQPAGAGDKWYLAVRALDEDFLGDPRTNSTQNLVVVFAVGIATAALIGLAALLGAQYLGKLKQEAYRDELTGVLSRRAASRLIENALGGNTAVSIGIIDLDRFKAVNDEHGHPVGDAVLKVVAQRMDQFCATRGGSVGRLGGDEFVVVSEEDFSWSSLSRLLNRPVEIADTSFDIGASIGVVVADPARYRAGSDLRVVDVLAEADLALFSAKRAGRGQVAFAASMNAN